MKVYQKTKYPKLFKNTYWGNFECDPNENASHPDIIDGRNHLVEFFDIIREETSGSAYKLMNFMRNNAKTREYMDHQEAYRTRDGRIVIFASPYCQTELPSECIDLGFSKDPFCKIYSTSAITWVAVYSGIKEIRSMLLKTKPDKF